MHSACRPTYAAHMRRCVGRQVRRWGRPRHARPRASRAPLAVLDVQRRVEFRHPRREGGDGLRQPCGFGCGRAGRSCATRRRAKPLAQAAPPRLDEGALSDVEMMGLGMPWGLATSLLGLMLRPGRHAVAAPAGGLRRRPARAHARRRRFRTTRAAARPGEEHEDDEQRHAVGALVGSCFFFRPFSGRVRITCLAANRRCLTCQRRCALFADLLCWRHVHAADATER